MPEVLADAGRANENKDGCKGGEGAGVGCVEMEGMSRGGFKRTIDVDGVRGTMGNGVEWEWSGEGGSRG